MKRIIIHCSATQNLPSVTAEKIKEWHLQRNFSDIGYHYVIETNGTVKAGRSLKRAGAHTKGFNRGSIGICLVGGVDEFGDPVMNFTEAQLQSLHGLVKGLQFVYNIEDSQVKGHRDYSPDLNKDGVITKNEFIKACPCFDVDHWMRTGEALLEVH